MNAKGYTRLGMMSVVVLLVSLVGFAGQDREDEEHERQVKQSEVPPPALAALKKSAGAARLEAFAEETEHGYTYYEGSWKSAQGNVDTLVTAAGDLMEIEESVSADRVPKPVIEKVRREAGRDATMRFERKTVIRYEVKYRKGDRWHEVVLSADGREHEHEETAVAGHDDDDD